MTTYEDFPDDLEEVEDNDGEIFEENENEANPSGLVPVDLENEESSKEPVKPKRVIRNPQPKLNAETLKGKKGLTALESYFDRVKYKGKGYEEQDLSVILKTYEYWCHRLFPKYPFDGCIAKIEHLGAKKAVKTHVTKIRLDMIQDDDDLPSAITNEDDDSGAEETQQETIHDRFDDLFSNTNVTPTPLEITEEQQERIRLNKEKATKLRQERLKKLQESSSRETSELPSTSQVSTESTYREIYNSQFDCIDNEEEDVNSIFDKIQSSGQEMNNSECSTSNVGTTVNLQNGYSDKSSFDKIQSSEQELNNPEQLERIRLNRERAKKIRMERLAKIQESSLTETNELPSTSHVSTESTDMEICPDNEEEDVDSIFDQIQSSGQEMNNPEIECSNSNVGRTLTSEQKLPSPGQHERAARLEKLQESSLTETNESPSTSQVSTDNDFNKIQSSGQAEMNNPETEINASSSSIAAGKTTSTLQSESSDEEL